MMAPESCHVDSLADKNMSIIVLYRSVTQQQLCETGNSSNTLSTFQEVCIFLCGRMSEEGTSLHYNTKTLKIDLLKIWTTNLSPQHFLMNFLKDYIMSLLLNNESPLRYNHFSILFIEKIHLTDKKIGNNWYRKLSLWKMHLVNIFNWQKINSALF